jgi:hypothetical protein
VATFGAHDALGLAPWEYLPVPLRFGAYGLPDERHERQSTMMEQSWDGAKELQDELTELAGPAGSEHAD